MSAEKSLPQVQILRNAENANLADLLPKPTALEGSTPLRCHR